MGFKCFQALSKWALVLLIFTSAPNLIAETLSQLALADPRISTPQQPDAHSLMNIPRCSAFNSLIDFHQKVLSPADGPRSHFAPVSSTYARRALSQFGFAGLTLVFDRLLRENDQLWVYKVVRQGDGSFAKLDPVPLADFE